MPVSSYVIRCAPEDQSSVREQLSRIPGVLMGQSTDSGIPVVTEAETSEAAEAMGNELKDLDGVQSAVLVYHNFEDVVDDVSAPARR